jgi:hypothetical protein
MFTVNTMAVRARSRPAARTAKMGARGIVEAVGCGCSWDYLTETAIVGARVYTASRSARHGK